MFHIFAGVALVIFFLVPGRTKTKLKLLVLIITPVLYFLLMIKADSIFQKWVYDDGERGIKLFWILLAGSPFVIFALLRMAWLDITDNSELLKEIELKNAKNAARIAECKKARLERQAIS